MNASRLEGLVLENAQANDLVSEAQVSGARAAHEAALASGEPSSFFAHLAEQLDPAARASVREIYQAALRDEFGGETVATEPPQPSPSGLDTVLPRSQLATVAEPPSVVGEALPVIPGYRIEDELGRGGMGVVYRAVSEASGEQVALKVLLAGAKATGEDLVRFRTEAEAAARLEHPHIVALLEHGQANGNPYMVLEYIEGEDLESRISRGKLQPADAVEIASGLADALSCAHEQGILHRDFKPQNVLLDREGHPLLTDFGLAKLRGDAAPTLSLTQSGMMLGTPAYMAPEQANAERHNIDERTDVYGLGATLYHMLTGQRPFSAPTLASLVVKILNEPPPRPRKFVPDLDPALETIVLKCLEKDRADRYPTALALQRDLNRWERNLAIVAAPPTLMTRVQRGARRNPAAAVAAAFAVLMLLVALAFGYRSLRAEAELEAKLAALQGQQDATPDEVDPPTTPEETNPPVTPGEVDPPTTPGEVDSPATPDEVDPPTTPEETNPPVTPDEVDPPATPGEVDPQATTTPPGEVDPPTTPEEDPSEPAPSDPALPPSEPTGTPAPSDEPRDPVYQPPPPPGPLPAEKPPAPALRRMLRLASSAPKDQFVVSWESAVQESRALRLPLAVLAIGPKVEVEPGSISWRFLRVLRERSVLVLAQPPHDPRRRDPQQACPLHAGLTCGDHMDTLSKGVVSALFGAPREPWRQPARPRRVPKKNPSFKAVVLFKPTAAQEVFQPPTPVEYGAKDVDLSEAATQPSFDLNSNDVGKALDRLQRDIGPQPLPLDVMRELGPHYSTLARLHEGDPKLSRDDVFESARALQRHATDEGQLGKFGRFALRGLCGLSIQRAGKREALAEELPALRECFGGELGCAQLLEQAERYAHPR